MPEAVDALLETWTDIEADGSWPSLLIGNGASIAVWPAFGYHTLYDEAELSTLDEEMFEALGGTKNFEVVLDSLRVSRLVCHQMGHDAADVATRYEEIKAKLITAVNNIHAPWASVPRTTLASIGEYLLTHKNVFSTNYDLLIYWSLREASGHNQVGDYFWNPDLEFDLQNTEPAIDFDTVVHYLHGGLHIYRLSDGRTVKRSPPPGKTLLDLLGQDFHGIDLPLVVNEGTSDDKLKVIRSSDYLSFTYRALSTDASSLVIFGNGLGAQDAHLARAIAAHPGRRVAISMRRGSALETIAKKVALLNLLSGVELRFFDAATHPLGSPELLAS